MTRNIMRVNKNKNYTVMSNCHLRDVKLSWKAKGIHSYILSLPDDWRIILTHLETMATDGERSMRSGLKELYNLNYWQKYPVYQDGKIVQWVTEIYEEPFEKKDKVKSVSLKDGKKITTYEHAENTNIELLCYSVDVGIEDVDNVHVEKDKLLSTNSTKDLSFSNNSFNQSSKNDRVNKYKQIISKIDLESFREYQGAIEQAIRILYYADKPLYLNNINTPPTQIREDLNRLEWKHIDLALRDFKIASEREEINNVTAYLARCIYNSIFNSNLKLEAEQRYNDII